MTYLRDFIQDLLTPLLATIAGLYFYRTLGSFHRILVWQVVLYMAIDLVALKIKTDRGNSAWLYNLFMPAETALFLLAAYRLLPRLFFRNLLLLLYALFGGVFFYDMYRHGFFDFAEHSSVIQGALLLVVFLALIYRSFKDRGKIPVICSMTGMAFYFAAVIPFIGVMFYIDQRNAWLSETMFEWIVISAQLLRYFLLALGFYLEARTAHGQSQIPQPS